MQKTGQPETPMTAVPLLDFLECGHIPRSNEKLAKLVVEGLFDLIIFVSHRWWGGDKPDREDNIKYRLLCDGLRNLAKGKEADRSKVGVWMDYPCIEQDNDDLKWKGVQSLIRCVAPFHPRACFDLAFPSSCNHSFAATADCILVPSEDSFEEFGKKEDIAAIENYGERAWCRLE